MFAGFGGQLLRIDQLIKNMTVIRKNKKIK